MNTKQREYALGNDGAMLACTQCQAWERQQAEQAQRLLEPARAHDHCTREQEPGLTFWRVVGMVAIGLVAWRTIRGWK